jgi:hypothetical protein
MSEEREALTMVRAQFESGAIPLPAAGPVRRLYEWICTLLDEQPNERLQKSSNAFIARTWLDASGRPNPLA